MSLENCTYWNNDNLQKHAEEIEEIGYFAALNLSYNCTDFEIKKNYAEISQQLQITQTKGSLHDTDHNENFLIDKMNLQAKRKLMRRIVDAYKVLESENLRKQYLDEIKIRCYLSQVISLDQLVTKYSGRLFPFFIFELHKKSHGLFQDSSHRFFHINFIDMIMEERKDERLIRAFNFSSIKQAVAGFKNNELYLTITNGRDVETFHYQVRYPKQRSLLLELSLFAKRLSEKKASLYSEKMYNPSFPETRAEKTPEKIVQNVLGTQINQLSDNKPLKLLTNDRITPAKQLFYCEVYAKSSNFLCSQKKLWFHLGTSQIIIANDKSANNILRTFPIDREYMSLLKTSESGTFTITCQDIKYSFRASIKQDVDTIVELLNQIYKEKVQNDHIIYSLPYNKKDVNVMKMLTRKLEDVDAKIRDTKMLLRKLKREKSLIKTLFVKEKEKTKLDPDLSEDTVLSKISSFAKISSQKDGTSLGRIVGSLTLTTPPRSPRSRVIEEKIESNQSIEQSKDSRFSFHKSYPKSMTFTERIIEIKTDLPKQFKDMETVSPEFRKSGDLGETKLKLKGLELIQHHNLDDSLSEELKQLADENGLNQSDMYTLGYESPKKIPIRFGNDFNQQSFAQSSDRESKTTKVRMDVSPSFCRNDIYDNEMSWDDYTRVGPLVNRINR